MRHEMPGVPHQVVQQFVLNWGEFDRRTADGHLVVLDVKRRQRRHRSHIATARHELCHRLGRQAGHQRAEIHDLHGIDIGVHRFVDRCH